MHTFLRPTSYSRVAIALATFCLLATGACVDGPTAIPDQPAAQPAVPVVASSASASVPDMMLNDISNRLLDPSSQDPAVARLATAVADLRTQIADGNGHAAGLALATARGAALDLDGSTDPSDRDVILFSLNEIAQWATDSAAAGPRVAQ